MTDLRYTLLAEGSSDKALMPILTWLLQLLGVERAIQQEWADLWPLPRRPRGITEKVIKSVELYPCDLLFVHRDSDGYPIEDRVAEIQRAVEAAEHEVDVPPVICVIPVRMQEAWLLFDAAAIRRAAGNPNGRDRLTLPDLRRVESLADPKSELYNLIRTASGLTGRRLKMLRVPEAAAQVSAYIKDFSPLRELNAFAILEDRLRILVKEQGW